MPNESTGFSPSELLYGRTPRGPVAISREVWKGSKHEQEVQNTYQYVLDLKNSLAGTCSLAQESACVASQRCRHNYGRKARMRKFRIGDEALLLLPIEHSKLLMKWKGPYFVMNVSGPVDYRINVDSKVKIFHVNMLRKYERRADPDVRMIARVVDTVHGCVDAVCVDDAEIPSHVQVQTLNCLPSIA